MKKIYKKVAALLFAAAMTGLPVGTAFFNPSGGMTVWAENTVETPTETQPESVVAEEIPPETQAESAAAKDVSAETQPESAAAEEISAEVQAESAAAVETAAEAPAEQPEVQITINAPEGWQSDRAKVSIRVEDVRNTGAFSIAKVEARISENGVWSDVTQGMEVEVAGNCSVYVRVTDQNGNTYEQNRYVECFDKTKPTLSAAAKNGVLLIQGADEGSGVAAIYVNGNEFTELTNNALKVRLQKADTAYQYFTLQARDRAGNMSENYKVANPYYENPDAVSDTSDGAGNEQQNNSLPTDAAPTEPTSATATVTEYQATGGTSAETEQPESTSSGEDTGRVQGDVSSSAGTEGGKEFYTITTKSDKVFYLIVDKDKADENVYLLTEVGENDLLNFTDTNTVTLPQNNAVLESSLPLEPVEATEEPEPESADQEEPEDGDAEAEKKETGNNSGTLLLMAVVLIAVGGGYYYLKFVKGKKDAFDPDYDEDDEEDEGEEETTNEDEEEQEDSEAVSGDGEEGYPENEEYM